MDRSKRVEFAYRRRVMEAGAELIRLLNPDFGNDGLALTYTELLNVVRDECATELRAVLVQVALEDEGEVIKSSVGNPLKEGAGDERREEGGGATGAA